jgi:hypothetical protein
VNVVRRAQVVGLCGALATTTTSCVDVREVLDVVLEPVVARAVADDVADEGAHEGFAWVDEDGAGNGLGASAGEGFTLLSTTTQLSFSVRVDDVNYTHLQALGRTGFVRVRDDDGVATSQLRQRVLLAPVDRVGALVDVPVPLGGDECVVGDEVGRLFIVGGTEGNQGGYVVDDFAVAGLDDASPWQGQAVSGCGASSGQVAAVAGCETAGAVVVVAGVDARRVSLAAVAGAQGAVSCAARVAPAPGGVWLVDGGALYFVDDDGVVVSTTTTAASGFRALSTTTAGEAVVIDAVGDGAGDGASLRVVSRDGASREVRAGLGANARLGRRFGDVVMLDGAVLVSQDGEVLRDDVAAELSGDDVVAFAVLSDATVVALSSSSSSPGALRVSTSGAGVKTLSLSSSRSGVSVLPGDTVVLAGGGNAGVDVVALGEHRVQPPTP